MIRRERAIAIAPGAADRDRDHATSARSRWTRDDGAELGLFTIHAAGAQGRPEGRGRVPDRNRPLTTSVDSHEVPV
ncbi:hypothetical protein WMF27_11210 [Sorangium sp. So ce281]|uniref:hypothetical protein n=1 Tax=unclassified Sorangium TaxID=2621164 RepID=UPI003F5EDD24